MKKPVVPEISPAMFLGFRPGAREHTLDFPLYTGKQWRYSYKLRLTNTVNVQVVGQERVATEAGIFNAVKIERTRQHSTTNPRWGTGTFTTDGVYFYSPEARSIVKYDAENVYGAALHIELLKFEPTRSSW